MPADQPPLAPSSTLDDATIWRRLHLLERFAVAVLQAGRSATETLGLLRALADGLQLHGLLVDTAGRSVTLEYTDPAGRPFIRVGVAASIDAIDCDALRRLELLAENIIAGRLDESEAMAEIHAVLDDRRSPFPPMLGLSVLALSVALQVGGQPLTGVLAALTQLIASMTGWLLGRIAMPRVFLIATQAITAAVIAAALAQTGVIDWQQSTVIVGVVWMLAVPQPMLVTAVIDAVNSEHLAAVARAAGVLIAAGGLILGGAVVLTIGDALQLGGPAATMALPTLSLPLVLLFSAIGAMGNAIANKGDRGLLWRAGFIGLGPAVINQLLLATGLNSGWTSALTAVLLGYGAAVWARRIPYPAPALGLVGVTGALLPGLVVYQGVYQALFFGRGSAEFVNAGVINLGLGVGLALGIYLAALLPGRDRARPSRG